MLPREVLQPLLAIPCIAHFTDTEGTISRTVAMFPGQRISLTTRFAIMNFQLDSLHGSVRSFSGHTDYLFISTTYLFCGPQGRGFSWAAGPVVCH